MKFRFDFHPELTFHGWKDYNYFHIIPRITLFTAPRFRSNWDETLIGQDFDFTIGWLVFEVDICVECLWKEIATPKFSIGDHICNEDNSDAVVESVNFDAGGTHWTYQCLDLDRNSEDYDKYFYINAEIEHLWNLKRLSCLGWHPASEFPPVDKETGLSDEVIAIQDRLCEGERVIYTRIVGSGWKHDNIKWWIAQPKEG